MQRLLAARISLRRRQVRHAITDLYDEERRTFLIQYPVWLIIALGIVGVVAFAVTGFLGYENTPTYFPFGDPIVLLPWLYALQFTLLLSIFRHPTLRWRRFVMGTALLLCIVTLGYLYVNSAELQALITQALQRKPSQPAQQPSEGPLTRISTNPWAYLILNFGILAIFWLDTARRWIRRGMGLSPNPEIDLGLDESGKRRKGPPRVEDMISGDLIAGTVLSFALALLLSPAVIGALTRASDAAATCAVALPGACANGAAPGPAAMLATLDTIQALVTLVLGLIILGLAATLNGLGAIGGVGAAGRADAGRAQRAGGSARKVVSEEVSMTVLKSLQNALDRRIRLALTALALALRNVVWPVLLLVATAALGIAGEVIEAYLHTDNKDGADAIGLLLLAAALGMVAAVFTAFSAALFIFRWRVATNSLKFLGLVGFVVLLTFWLFSLALSGFNLLLNATDVTRVHPFLPIGLTTAASFVALLIYGALAVRRLLRGSQAGADDGGDAGPADAGGAADATS
jgi:hypothetical protein